jgi:hypothetical protein
MYRFFQKYSSFSTPTWSRLKSILTGRIRILTTATPHQGLIRSGYSHISGFEDWGEFNYKTLRSLYGDVLDQVLPIVPHDQDPGRMLTGDWSMGIFYCRGEGRESLERLFPEERSSIWTCRARHFSESRLCASKTLTPILVGLAEIMAFPT